MGENLKIQIKQNNPTSGLEPQYCQYNIKGTLDQIPVRKMKPAPRIKLHTDDILATLESFLLEQKPLQESEGMES